MGAYPAIVANADVAVAAAEVGDVSKRLDLRREWIAAEPIGAMVAAQIDFDIACDRGIGAYAQGGTFIPVVDFHITIGAQAEAVLRVTVTQFLGGTFQLSHCP